MDDMDKYFVGQIFFETFDWMEGRDITTLYDKLKDDIISDIEECADFDAWNSSDVRITIRRVLFKALDIEE